MRSRWGICTRLLATLGLLTSSSWAVAQELVINDDTVQATQDQFPGGIKWRAYTDWTARPGNTRALGDGMLMLPLWQDSERMIFADIRGQVDNRDNREGNWGLAYRKIVDDSFIVGMYGFYDLRRTDSGNNFSQGTLGFELLSVCREIRINGYIPEEKVVEFAGTEIAPQAVFANNTIVVQSGGALLETSYGGFDGEFGTLLHDWKGGNREIRGFVGGYRFEAIDPRFPIVGGPKARIEMRGYDLSLLGEGSRLVASVEYQWDEVREDQVYGGLQVRIPFGRSQQKLNRLERRMLDRVVRDIDIVSSQVNDPIREEIAQDVSTNLVLDSVTRIDGNTPDAAATVAASTSSVIYANGNHGVINTANPLVLKDGQSLLGGNRWVRGTETGQTVLIGARPTINGTDSNQNVVVMTNNTRVANVNITGGQNGIIVDHNNDGTPDAATNVVIAGNSVSGAAQHGVYAYNLDFQSAITGNEFIQNAGRGFYAHDVAGTVSLNSVRFNGSDGIGINSLTASGKFTQNELAQNGYSGLAIFSELAGEVSENVFLSNNAHGLYMHDFSSTGEIKQNYIISNLGNGFVVANTFAGKFTDNTVTGNMGSGALIIPTLDATGEISNNDFHFNFGNGLGLYDGVAGDVIGNSILYNGSDGLFAYGPISSTGSISGNTSNSNSGDGFLLFLWINGEMKDNVANDNLSRGYRQLVGSVNSGTIINNTGSGNASGGNTLP